MDASKPLVYVVDDEEIIAGTLAVILNNSGFHALSFSDAEQAVAAAESGSPPDLLLSDVAMPGMSGVELAIRFQQRYPQCKILLFSGEVMVSRYLKDARRQDCEFEVLRKPMHPEDLIAKLQKDLSGCGNGLKAVLELSEVVP